ncbi:MAG: glycosyltransferase family 39 protein [Candidatus Bathyarchaeota archaeon]|nr:glycosyltransferase family 39 protein [Candidatus Bathyarchaeota archaeon]
MKKEMRQRFLTSKPIQGLGRWRLTFLVFLVVYLAFLVFNLGSLTIQWDEANHLGGALLLLHGRTELYVASSLFYPPLDDLIIAGFFALSGPSVFVGRLLSVIFAVLSIWALFEFTYRTYGPKTAFLSSVLLATMPGFFWLSRVVMLETMLVFFFSVSMMLFFLWLQKHENKYLAFSAIALGLGFLTKYQVIIAVPTRLVCIFLLCRRQLKDKLSRFPFLLLAAALIVLPWIIFSYQAYTSGLLDQWVYAMGTGNPQKYMYSLRFPEPLFYLIELTWPYGAVHPVSLFMYVVSLLGLGLLAVKRKPVDRFLLLWFFALYLFFTFIGNRQWRYMVPVLPVLAISAANLFTWAYDKAEKAWKQPTLSLNGVRVRKVAAACIVVVLAFSVGFSCVDAHRWVSKDNLFNLPVEQATNYAVSNLGTNGSLLILCPINVFSADIVKFYVYASPRRFTFVCDYPALPVDTYPPHFNIDELVSLCKQHQVKFLLLYEYGGSYPYYNSNLTMNQVYNTLMTSQRFSLQTSFGTYPNRIYVLHFD